MENLKGKSYKEISKEFTEKYKIDIHEWNRMIQYIKYSNECWKPGDVVKFKHEDEALGVVSWIGTDNVTIYYRDNKGLIMSASIKFECIEKVLTKIVVAIDGDGHFQVAKLKNREDTLNVLRSVCDGDYFVDVNKNPDINIYEFSAKEWENFIGDFIQRGTFEIIDI